MSKCLSRSTPTSSSISSVSFRATRGSPGNAFDPQIQRVSFFISQIVGHSRGRFEKNWFGDFATSRAFIIRQKDHPCMYSVTEIFIWRWTLEFLKWRFLGCWRRRVFLLRQIWAGSSGHVAENLFARCISAHHKRIVTLSQ